MAPPRNYSNPLIQTSALSVFSALPRKPVANADALTATGNAQLVVGATCSKCGHLNHWDQQCRSTGRRNSSTGGSPSPRKATEYTKTVQQLATQQRQETWRWQAEISTPNKKPGQGRGRGGKDLQDKCLNSHWIPSRTSTPSKSCRSGRKWGCKYKSWSYESSTSPKVTGWTIYQYFRVWCNGNELYYPPSNQGKAYTDTDNDGKTEIITDITCKFRGKLIAMEVKVDPGSEINCIPLSHFRHLFPQLCSKDRSPKENALEPTLAQFWSIWWWHSTQPQMDHTVYSGHMRQQEVSSCEILCGDQGGGLDPDKPCYSNLAGTHEGPISKQGAQDEKASSICF